MHPHDQDHGMASPCYGTQHHHHEEMQELIFPGQEPFPSTLGGLQAYSISREPPARARAAKLFQVHLFQG